MKNAKQMDGINSAFDINLVSDDGDDSTFNGKRALLACAFLLSYSSGQGNAAADGLICEGISATLKLIGSKLPT